MYTETWPTHGWRSSRFDIRHGTTLEVGLLHFMSGVIAAQLVETRL